MRRLALVLFLVGASAFSGCKSPTEPETYVLDIGGVSWPYGEFGTVDGQPTLLELRMFLDGKEFLGTYNKHATPVATALVAGRDFYVNRGHHIFSLQVHAQTVSPTTYRSVDLKATLHKGLGPPVIATVTLPDQTKSLRTGESIDIEFDI